MEKLEQIIAGACFIFTVFIVAGAVIASVALKCWEYVEENKGE